MKGLKKVIAIVLLLLVTSMGSQSALAGVAETPGESLCGTTESPGVNLSGVGETPGFAEVVLFMATLILG